MGDRPRLVLRNGVVIEYPEDHADEVRGLEGVLGVGDDGRFTAAQEWIGVGHASLVRGSEVVAVLWSSEITTTTR